MKRYKFSDLLLYEEKIKNLYSRFGLSFSSSNRISQYFVYLGKIEKTRNLNDGSFSRLFEKDKSKYYFSQSYVLEICNIIDALENSNHDEKLVKEKLIDLVKGTYLLSEESRNNTKARDTSFELSLFSFFHSKGLDVKLDDPNPDLQLLSSNLTYNIECKRPNSPKSLEKHIKDAIKQLGKTTKANNIPTIALSLEQVLLGNDAKVDLILDSKDEKSALSFLSVILYNFLQKNKLMLDKICRDKPFLVLYYLSCLVGFKADLPMSNATFITGNVYNFEPNLSNAIAIDLNTMIPQHTL